MRLLVPVDGSKHSMEGIKVALDYARMKGAEVSLLTVVPPITDITYGMTPSQGDSVKGTMMQKAEEIITEAKKACEENDVRPQVMIKDTSNTVAEEICDVVESENIDLVVIGSHGIGGVRRFLMGSVASRVVRHCPCSVFVVRVP